MFVERLRQDLTLRQVSVRPGQLRAWPRSANAGVAFDALLQQREVQLQRFKAQDYAAAISPSDAELEAFYKDPQERCQQFQVAENAQIQYLVLDLGGTSSPMSASAEEDLRKYYSENAVALHRGSEERRASHILIKTDTGRQGRTSARRPRPRRKTCWRKLRKNPAQFADLARKNSQDEGSAANGGDLDFFGRGAMVKPFEDAAYALKQGEISPLVESEFGYHIIQLTGVRGGEKKSFESAARRDRGRGTQAAGTKALSLKWLSSSATASTSRPTACSPWPTSSSSMCLNATVQRKPAPGATGPLASVKLLEAVFSGRLAAQQAQYRSC